MSGEPLPESRHFAIGRRVANDSTVITAGDAAWRPCWTVRLHLPAPMCGEEEPQAPTASIKDDGKTAGRARSRG
jgi:hypothetical protein